MKKLFVISILSLCSIFSFGQNGLEGIVVERIDANSAMAGATTYRVFVDMAADYQLQAVFGNQDHDLIIESDGLWYNDTFGAFLGEAQNEALLGAFPSAVYDSHISTGASSSSTLGVQYSMDTDGTVDGRTASTLPGGLIPSTAVGDVDNVLSDAFGGANTSADVNLGGVVGGSWATTSNNANSNASNTIYIGQFTTDGSFYFELNVQLRNTVTNEIEQWVASNPSLNEYQSDDLIYDTSACEAYNFEQAPSGLEEDQNSIPNRTTLKWDHYSDATDACILRGALSNGTTNTAGFGQILIQGALVQGNANVQDRSANLAPNAQYLLFNPNTFPAGATNNLVPGAQYMWQVRCGCIIDTSLPLPDRLAASNIHISPFSGFEFFTNLSIQESSENSVPESEKSLIAEGISIYPNPFNDLLTLELKDLNGLYEVQILDAVGKVVFSDSLSATKGTSKFEIDGSNLEAGIYIVSLINSNGIISKRIIKS